MRKTTSRWMLAALGLCVVAALIALSGCSTTGIIDRLFGDSSSGLGSAGNAVPGVRHSIGDTLGSLGLWLSLAGGISIFYGAWCAVSSRDYGRAAKAVAVGAGLIVVNGLVKLIVPALFYIVVPLTVIVGGFVAWRLATNRGIGGHSLKCILARLRGKESHDTAHATDGVNDE